MQILRQTGNRLSNFPDLQLWCHDGKFCLPVVLHCLYCNLLQSQTITICKYHNKVLQYDNEILFSGSVIQPFMLCSIHSSLNSAADICIYRIILSLSHCQCLLSLPSPNCCLCKLIIFQSLMTSLYVHCRWWALQQEFFI